MPVPYAGTMNSKASIRKSCAFPIRLCLFLLALLPTVPGGLLVAGNHPNILWITAEDMSPTLGCYGDAYAATPVIDSLAAQSVRYTHAFATAPVCSPSRACLINGLAATSQGTHPMRSLYPLPDFMKGFPALLREKGYFTTNNVKTDYNTSSEQSIISASWDRQGSDAHWRQRPDSDQPFFSVFNLMTSHQSRTMVWPDQQFREEIQSQLPSDKIHDPALAPVPPYYPDTGVIRRTIARYYDCVSLMDQQVGEILAQLAEDNLADSTIVFFYSDHGSGMPRHKRILLDSGMHVPLVIHFPDQWNELAPSLPGSTSDRLVCFEDFGPTTLSLAGIRPPEYMNGIPFLGAFIGPERDAVFGHRDRIDEATDLSRSVRSKRYLYIRNYMPHRGWNQQSAWPDQGTINQEIESLARQLHLSPAQRHYTDPSRPVEELYDCMTDPLNLFNLAQSHHHRDVLTRMRAQHRDHIINSVDLGFIPEIELAGIAATEPAWTWARRTDYSPEAHLNAAALTGTGRIRQMTEGMSHDDPVHRYWSAVALHSLSRLNEEATASLAGGLEDSSLSVRMECAAALVHHNSDRTEEALDCLRSLLDSDDPLVVMHACRHIEMLGEKSRPIAGAMRQTASRFEDEPGDMAWFIRFSTSGFLSRINSSADLKP